MSIMLRYADLTKSLSDIRKLDESKITIRIGNMIYKDSFELELDKNVVEMILVKEMNVIEELVFQEKTIWTGVNVMKYSEIREEISKKNEELKMKLQFVKELEKQKQDLIYSHELIVVNKDSHEEIKTLDNDDRKALTKQTEKLITRYTNEIGSLNIQIEKLNNQLSEIYEREENK